MGALAGLLKRAGHRVTGSDAAFHPPMGDALKRWGIETISGYRKENLEPAPDLVIVGNVCRPDHVEARAAIDRGLRVASMPAALASEILKDRVSVVVAGTHGKTTTTTLLAHLLDHAGLDPGLLVGGIPRSSGESFALGREGGPFVVEGDEYDSAFFEKTPKLWQYRAHAAILTSIEHDHLDIYPDVESYESAFATFVEQLPADGVLVAFAGDPAVRRIAARAPCRVVWYALDRDDTGEIAPVWSAAHSGRSQSFELFIGGTSAGPMLTPLMGAHNARNMLAAFALAAERFEIPAAALAAGLRAFEGVKRRQELIGIAGGVHVYDDFAHHPSAVRETIRAIRERHPRVIAAFEPRSATASRRLHETDYADALGQADYALIAPVGRKEIPASERLDVAAIARAIGDTAEAPADLDALLARILEISQENDAVLLMSNGDFGGLHDRVLGALAGRSFKKP
jgi:UDP-N-acetylmuramate: L-alanyl-gamma-D-glutamyl-meso-diaminopimelate ligase